MKKCLQLLFTVVFLTITHVSFSQNNMEDVVYLKNGSIYRGIIIEEVPNQSIKIQTYDMNVLFFKLEEIEKFTKEYKLNNKKFKNKNLDSDRLPSQGEIRNQGFSTIFESSFSNGTGTYDFNYSTIRNVDWAVGFKTVNGYQFNDYLFAGGGVGVDFYSKSTYLPVSLDVRMSLLKDKFTPTINANIGYAFALNGAVEGGYVVNPTVGFKVDVSEKVAYLFNVGVKFQQQTYVNEMNNVYYDGQNYYPYLTKDNTQHVFKYLTLSTGFQF